MTYGWIWQNRSLVLYALIPFFISTIVPFLALINPMEIGLFSPYLLLPWWFFVVAMVQIHQNIILGTNIKLFPKPEKSYFVYLIFWGLLNFFEKLSERFSNEFANTSSVIGNTIISFLFIGIVTYLFLRFYFVFPMIAVREELSKVIKISENESWKILKANFYTIVPVLIIAWIMNILLTIFFTMIVSVSARIYFIDVYTIIILYLKFLFFLFLNILYSKMYLEFRDKKLT